MPASLQVRLTGTFVGIAAALALAAVAAAGPRQDDVFVRTIAEMKRTVAPIACMEAPEKGVRRPNRIAGTAFFVSPEGEFLTAAHVITDVQEGAVAAGCAAPVVYLPKTDWPVGSDEFTARWYFFDAAKCVLDRNNDLALCVTKENPSVDLERRIGTVTFDSLPMPDGTSVAFTGFPLNAKQPMTARGHIAMYSSRNELILDQSAWPGVSGCPVYVQDGKVIGLLVQRGTGEGTGRSIVRTAFVIEEFLARSRQQLRARQ